MKNKLLLALLTLFTCCVSLSTADTTTASNISTSTPSTDTVTADQNQKQLTESPKTDRIKELNDVIYSDGSKKLVEDIKKATQLDYIDQLWFFSSWLRVIMNNRDGKSNNDVLGNGICTSLECSYSIRYYARQFHNNLIVAYNFLLLSSAKDLQTKANAESFQKLIAALEEIYKSEPKATDK